MHADTHTHTQSHTYTLAEVGDMEDARPVSGVRGGDGGETPVFTSTVKMTR